MFKFELEKKTVISDDLVNSAVQNLTNRGIDISPHIIDRNMPERDIYYYSLKRAIIARNNERYNRDLSGRKRLWNSS